MSLNIILGLVTVLSLLLGLWQFIVAMRFPLHRRRPVSGPAPGISLLKPLKGCDAETAECLRSWLTQAYDGEVEVLFGVASAEDPVCAVVEGLMREHPDCPAQLVICGARRGPNAKVSKLVQLARRARYDVLCVSDADVWMPPDGLASIVRELLDPAVGLANCLYRFPAATSLATRLEAFAVNGDFWGQVLQARALRRLDFALGAAMVLRREPLEKIGGFEAVEEFLADDFELGHRIAATGLRVVLSPVVVECRSAPMDAAGVWTHQVRWARTVRGCRPLGYFFSVLANATVWPVLWAGLVGNPASLAALGFCLGFRMLAAFCQERRMTGRASMSSCGVAVMKDVAQVAVWAAAFTGRTIVWRGEQLRLEAGGKLARSANS